MEFSFSSRLWKVRFLPIFLLLLVFLFIDISKLLRIFRNLSTVHLHKLFLLLQLPKLLRMVNTMEVHVMARASISRGDPS